MPDSDAFESAYAEFRRVYEAGLLGYRPRIDAAFDALDAGVASREDVLRITAFPAVEAFTAGLSSYISGKMAEDRARQIRK